MPKFAANLTMMFNEVPFPERFAAAARAGFDAVEFLFPYDHAPEDVARWLRENKLRNVLFNMPPGDWAAGERGIASLPGREQEFKDGVAKALVYAQALGTPNLHVMAGLLPVGADRAERLALYESNVRYAAERLRERGLTLLIEPINGRDMPGYLLQMQAEAHAICERIGASNLKVQFDLYHAQIMGGDLSVTMRKHIQRIGHVQVAGVPERHEPDEGELNVRYLFDLLDELGYAGSVGCEYRPRGKTEHGLKWLDQFKNQPTRVTT
jgi:hydroxypyruvate isomerase